jgi:hypothetical protein
MELPELLAERALLPLLAWPELLALEGVSRDCRRLLAGSSRWRAVELRHEPDARLASALLARVALLHGTSVQRLVLIDCFLSDRALLLASTRLANLSELTVSGCRQLSDASFGALVGGLTADSLVDVRAAKCPELTDASLRVLAKRHGASLRHVNLSHCRLLSADGVAQFARSCHSLRSLALKGCPAANSASLAAVAAHCKALEVLTMGGAGNVSDDALVAVADSCPSLRSLDVSRSNPFGLGRGGLSDSAVVYLASRCQHLEYVNLGGQGRLTLAAVDALREHCPLLTTLEIGGCVGLTTAASGLVSVLRRMPALQSLNLSFARGDQAALIAAQCDHLAVFRVDSARPSALAA